MAWTSSGSILLSNDWQYTEPIADGSFFRLKHTEAPNGGLFAIAQCEIDADGKLSLIDSQVLAVEKPIIDVLRLDNPGCFAERRIAIKKIPRQPSLQQELRRLFLPGYLQPTEEEIRIVSRSKWAIEVEVSDFIEPPPTTGTGTTTPPSSTTKTLTYVSDGDINGVFYYIGTSKGTETWSNPSSKIIFTASSILNGRGPDKLADRSITEITNDAHTNRENNAWFKVDLGLNRLVINHYTLQARPGTDQQPRSWKIEGSNDDITYVELDVQNNNPLLSNGSFYSKPISNQTESYKYYKLTQTGVNSVNDTYFVLGEWELYGTLTNT